MFPLIHREPYRGQNPIDVSNPVNILSGVPENIIDVDEDDDRPKRVSSGSDTEDDEWDGEE